MGVGLSVYKTVRKSNTLNEIRNSDITTYEYRLFCIYLAHFKMNDPDDNTVTFNLSDYTKIVGLDRPRPRDIDNQAKNILSRSVRVRNADGGFDRYSIFDNFKLHKIDDTWCVTLECGKGIGPLIREERGKFIRYKLYNAIFLKSFNQQRIYELLKQYEKIGQRTLQLEDLREYLSIGKNEYPVWYNFSRDVLKVAQKAIAECTDITFEYEPIKKGKKVVAVKFVIKKNDAYKDLLQLEGFLPPTPEFEYDGDELEITAPEDYGDLNDIELHVYENSHVEFLASALEYEFNQQQMEVLLRLPAVQAQTDVGQSLQANQLIKHNYLALKYKELALRCERTDLPPVKSRFAYLKKIILDDF